MTLVKLDYKKILNRLIVFIGVGVVGHIIFVLSTTERSLLSHLNQLSIFHIIAICILMICPWLGYAARVVMWSGFLNEKISYPDAFRVVVTADVASALSPTAVGGAPVKAALLINRGYGHGNVGFMLTYGVIEDIIFYITGIVLAAFFSKGLLANIGHTVIVFVEENLLAILLTVIFVTAYVLLLIYGIIPEGLKFSTYLPVRFKNWLYSFRQKLRLSYTDMKANFRLALNFGKLRMLASLTILFLQWMAKFSVLLVILNAFEVNFDVTQIYVRQWVIYVTMLLIPTPGASGGAEASFLLIFGKSIPADLSYLIVSTWRLFTYYFILLTAVFAYTGLTYLLKKREGTNITDNVS